MNLDGVRQSRRCCRRKGGAGSTHVRAQPRYFAHVLVVFLPTPRVVPVNKKDATSIADGQFLLVRFNTLDQVIEIVYSVTLDDRQLASV